MLVEKLLELDATAAQPHLYQMLGVLMENQRNQDAWRVLESLRALGEATEEIHESERHLPSLLFPVGIGTAQGGKVTQLPRPVSVLFIRGDTNVRARSDKLRQELMGHYKGLTLDFDHSAWKQTNMSSILAKVERYDVFCPRTVDANRYRQKNAPKSA